MSARACGRNAPSSRFSSTVSLGKSRLPSGTSATPRLTISSVESFVKSKSFPSKDKTTRPFVGRTMPITHFIRVLLPLPLVPSSATVSFSLMEREMPCSARTAP